MNDKDEVLSELRKAIMLQCNDRLYERKLISQEMYEQAKVKIVSGSKSTYSVRACP